jgi:hypothetical protein
LGSAVTFGAQSRRGLPFRFALATVTGRKSTRKALPGANPRRLASRQKTNTAVEGLATGQTGKPAGEEVLNKIGTGKNRILLLIRCARAANTVS